MTLRAPRLGEVISGISAVVLLVSLWLPWYGPDAGAGLAALGVLGYVLLVIAAIALIVFFAQVTQPSPALAVAFSACGLSISLVGTVWTLIRVLSPPEGSAAGYGWLALAGVAGVLAGIALGLRDEGDDFWPGAEAPEPTSKA